MASRPMKEALGIGALGEFAKAFVAARQQKMAQDRADLAFQRELASKRLEDEAAQRYKDAQLALNVRKAIQDVTEAGAKTAQYDATGRLTGYIQKGISPETVAAGQKEYQDILNAYQGLPGLQPAQPSGLPGLSASGSGVSITPVPLKEEVTGMRPASSVKVAGGGGGTGGADQSQYIKTFEAEAAKSDVGVLSQQPAIQADLKLLEDTASGLETGKFKTGPGQSLALKWRQPEFSAKLDRIKNIAIAEYGKAYKGAMSDREFATMIKGAVDPENLDEASIASNLRDLAEMRKLSLETAKARAKWVEEGKSVISFPLPNIQPLIDRIKARSEQKAAPSVNDSDPLNLGI